ncbi:protein FRA10AC1 homolog isoform X2 [Octopus sinensis]|uniref:Protein FRA10AC1 homolog isoform X2 n=1 Tax=Octopus sinensis TaxID=2607531 RepID=A0A6P7TK10_9MOLL|nr:protein FRA10AC1 homolog isoform X2 [Octopus sinensis]
MSEKTNFVKVHRGSYYDSDFDSDPEISGNTRRSTADDDRRDSDEADASLSRPSTKAKKRRRKHPKYSDHVEGKRQRREDSFGQKKQHLHNERSAELSRIHRFKIVSMDAYSRHKKFINDYLTFYGGKRAEFVRDSSRDKTDLDIIREHHRFLWSDDDDSDGDDLDVDDGDSSWEKRLAKRYYDKLYKEYCITDLSRYKENKVALRWRMEKEVISGKGQFVCGEKKCPEKEGLRSWEVNFGYVEHGEKKNALVKVRLCPDCSYKLNYRHQRKEIKANKKKDRRYKGDVSDAKRADKETDESAAGEGDGERRSEADSGCGSSSVWEGPAKVEVAKSRDQEFESYFEDMFL